MTTYQIVALAIGMFLLGVSTSGMLTGWMFGNMKRLAQSHFPTLMGLCFAAGVLLLAFGAHS